MHPDLFSLGFFQIKTYGACMALGFLCAWQVATWLCKRMGRNADELSSLLMYMLVAGVLGARAAYVIEHWSDYANDLVSIIRVDQGGLMFYGGLILSVFTFIIWCIFKKQKIVETADLVLATLPIGHAFGRLGCFFFGCCYGKMSDSCLAVSFPRSSPAWGEQYHLGLIGYDKVSSLPVLPTQLFESFALILLFAFLVFLYLKFARRAAGLVTGAYFILYAIIRFFMEYLRGDPRAQVLHLFSIGQTISLGIFLLGLAFVTFAWRNRNEESAN